MKVTAIIVGIDGWEKYTLPLVESIHRYEPDCYCVIVDNASEIEYPQLPGNVMTVRSNRLCYSAAINLGHAYAPESDWYIVLSNDVLCTGPFIERLSEYGNEVVGPLLKTAHGYQYLEGWCVAIPCAVWDAIGGWDMAFQGSDWEDVDYSTMARKRGFWLIEDSELSFTHLDQRQRFHVVDNFWAKNQHNSSYFMRKHAQAVTA